MEDDYGDSEGISVPTSISNTTGNAFEEDGNKSSTEAVRAILRSRRRRQHHSKAIIVFGVDAIHGFSAARILQTELWEVVGVAKAKHPFTESELTPPQPLNAPRFVYCWESLRMWLPPTK